MGMELPGRSCRAVAAGPESRLTCPEGSSAPGGTVTGALLDEGKEDGHWMLIQGAHSALLSPRPAGPQDRAQGSCTLWSCPASEFEEAPHGLLRGGVLVILRYMIHGASFAQLLALHRPCMFRLVWEAGASCWC